MKKVVLAVMTIAVSANFAQASGIGRILGQGGRFEAKSAALKLESEALKSSFGTALKKTQEDLNSALMSHVQKTGSRPQMLSREADVFDKELASGEFFQIKVRSNLSMATGKPLSHMVFVTNTTNSKILKDISDIFSVDLQRWKSLDDLHTTTLLLTDDTSDAVLKQIDMLVKKINADTLGKPAAQLSRKTIKPNTDK